LTVGTFDLRIVRPGYLTHTTSVTLVEGETIALGTITLTAEASVAGIVTSNEPGYSVTNAIVGVFDGDTEVMAIGADAAGAFDIAGLEVGTYTLRVTNNTIGFSTEETITVVEGQAISGMTLSVLPGASLIGVVTNSVSATPLANVEVYAYTLDGRLRTSFTDDQGRYRIDHVGLGVHTVLLPTSNASQATAVDVTAIDGDEFTVDLAFASVGTLAGLVTDSDGTPLVGAAVRLIENDEFIITNRSDENGRYTFLLNRTGDFQIDAAFDGASFSPVAVTAVADQTVDQDITSGTASIVTILTDVTQAVEGATVFLYQLSGNAISVIGSAIVGPTLEVRFKHLAAGDYTIQAIAANSRGVYSNFSLADGQALNLSAELDQQFLVNGTVRDSNGDPIAGAKVWLVSTTDPNRRLLVATTADGRYEFLNASADTYDIVVIADGLETNVREGVVVIMPMGVDLTLFESTSQITGRVVGSGANPVRQGNIEITDAQGRVVDIAGIQPDGTFTATGAVGAGLTATVRISGFVPVNVTDVAVNVGSTIDLGDLIVDPVAMGQGFGQVAAPIDPPFGAATARLMAMMEQNFTAQANPGWLESLFGDQDRHPDEVQIGDIPELDGCTVCTQVYVDAILAKGQQNPAFSNVEIWDDNLDTQALVDGQLGTRAAYTNWDPNVDTDRNDVITTRDRITVARAQGRQITLPAVEETVAIDSSVIPDVAPFVPTARDDFYELIGLDAVWDQYDYTGDGYAIAVIDTGIDYTHPSLAGRVILGPDFADGDDDPIDTIGHGTHVAGLLASIDVLAPGIVQDASLIALKVTQGNTLNATQSDVEQALQWVLDHQDQFNIVAVNLSFGGGTAQLGDAPESIGALYQQISQQGIFVGAAAGNAYFSNGSQEGVSLLAASEHVVSVGAVWDSDAGAARWSSGAQDYTTGPDRIASFSQRSVDIDLFAPGGDILGLALDDGYIVRSGTSMATPLVVGTAVLMRQAADQLGLDLNPTQVIDLLQSSSDRIFDGDDEDDNVSNTHRDYVRLNVAGAIQSVQSIANEQLADQSNTRVSTPRKRTTLMTNNRRVLARLAGRLSNSKPGVIVNRLRPVGSNQKLLVNHRRVVIDPQGPSVLPEVFASSWVAQRTRIRVRSAAINTVHSIEVFDQDNLANIVLTTWGVL